MRLRKVYQYTKIWIYRVTVNNNTYGIYTTMSSRWVCFKMCVEKLECKDDGLQKETN